MSKGCKWTLIAFCVPGVALFLWALTQIPGSRAAYQKNLALERELNRVCQGKAYPAAAAFAGSEIHPIFLEDASGASHPWNLEMPAEWQPADADQVELVACLESSEVMIQTCSYTGGGSIARYRYDLSAQIIEAQSGRLVAERVFQGSEPRECGLTEPANLTALFGRVITFPQIKDWLASFVYPSAEKQQ
ncbi:MAG: hypothetical protein WD751_11125 [Anaerolineales bacterium]